MSKFIYNLSVFILAVVYSQFCFGGQIDSLKQLLSETHDLERKIELHTLLAKRYQIVDIGEARYSADKALKLSTSGNIPVFLGEIYGLFGDVAVLQDSLKEAQHYYEVALDYFLEEEDLEGAIGVSSVLGNIAMTHDDLHSAMLYYQKAIDIANTNDLEDWLPSIHINIGTIYYKSGQIKEAQEYFISVIDEARLLKYESLAGEALNNLGLTYLDLEDYETAKSYFKEAINNFEEQKAYIRSSRSLQNLALSYQLEGNYPLAIETLTYAEEIFEKGDPEYAGPKQTLVAAQKIGLGINNLMLNKDNMAHLYLMEGLNLSLNLGQLKSSAEAMLYLSRYWEKMNNADSALYYFKLHTSFSDSLNTKDNIRKLEIQKAQFRHDEELLVTKQEMEKEETQNRLYLTILIAVIVSLILVSALLSLLVKLGRNKIKQGELEQKNLKIELNQRNKELTTYLIYQIQNNEFILNISKKLKSLYSNSKPENKSLINQVISQIEQEGTTSHWDEFEIRFQQVHTDFYKNLGKKFPDLTSNELRLCAFLKLNMNTKDIAAITYQSTNSITVARWRLRQKFGLDKEGSLSTFLTQF